ncbi:MAG TPA: bifunctional [glutamate--ammonia ligase]-adenylyl-L-tyrosine phosphorylase/[glutamate--ammonia-ligase] adenylyltransferase [Steroidobacteraceae bacterium]|nr:bifunctional [glutamate--ammonia ligase]-adenylyl-L-tyrosine phosphorylase/[glutamate--ammonia-ligase] adenylyltransferase [Steroidobacteraceae bacterium]
MSLPSLPDHTPSSVRASAAAVFAASDFVAGACERDPALLEDLIAGGDLLAPAAAGQEEAAAYFARSAPAWPQDGTGSEARCMELLRRWRTREMVRIAWRDLAGWAPLQETLGALSAFADAAIGAAQRTATGLLAERHGLPRSASGELQELIVVGMGKLGGGELNFSSDVDLVLLYPEGGQSDGPRPLSNAEFFTRVGQALIRLLSARTAQGFVFRVDMRLRPFGESGPLVSSFAAFEDYLQLQGREWERYAWIKARPVTGAARYAGIYESAVRPFVYRRYLDYGVFESLREMKALIGREVQRRDLADNVKLGPGGIREVEFVVQALQLLRGGQQPQLRTPSLLAALPLLARARLLSPGAAGELLSAYAFLRRLENRLQMRADEQVHALPAAAAERQRIARAMGAADWKTLEYELALHRECVGRHFRSIVDAAGGAAAEQAPAFDLESLTAAGAEQVFAGRLAAAGFGADAGEAARLLAELRTAAFVRRLDDTGRRRLQALLPALVRLIGTTPAPLPVLRRILAIIEAIGLRSSYFALLYERPAARARLVELCSHGDFLAGQIAREPMLLDDLIDERVLDTLPGREGLREELELRAGLYLEQDPERQVEGLRHFQRSAVFRVAVADLTGRLPVMRVSDRLTEIAELILERVLEISWRQISRQYGVPMCGEGAQRRPVSMCVVGYGKLGGMELGYGSDLDLVFLHDSQGERQETGGPRPIDNQVFFLRLGQRILHLLTMHSAAGRLYDVDVRLRPSGKGGLLVTSLAAFADYQRTEAWTWEHQALLHARAVAGDPALGTAFEAIRMQTLQQHVRRQQLRADVRNMRLRMRRELSKAGPGQFDIKHDAGGVADIEFLAQYWALAWALRHPAVAMFADTIRQLESVASGNLVPQSTVDVLTGAYRSYRERTHHLSLQGAPPIVPEGEFAGLRTAVTAVWNAAMTEA